MKYVAIALVMLAGCATPSSGPDVADELRYAWAVAENWSPGNEDYLERTALIHFTLHDLEGGLATLRKIPRWNVRFWTLYKAIDPILFGQETSRFALKHADLELKAAPKAQHEQWSRKSAEDFLAEARVRMGAGPSEVAEFKTRTDDTLLIFRTFLKRGDVQAALEFVPLNKRGQREAAEALAEIGAFAPALLLLKSLPSQEDRDAVMVRLIQAGKSIDYVRCEDLLKEVVDPDYRSDALRSLAEARWAQGHGAAAKDLLKRAEAELERSEASGVTRGQVYCLHAELWFRWKEPGEADRCVKAAREAMESLPEPTDENSDKEWIRSNLAETLARIGDLPAARREIASLGRHARDWTLFTISTDLVARGELSQIEALLQDINSEIDRAEILITLAERRLKEGGSEEAKACAARAMSQLEEERRIRVKDYAENGGVFETVLKTRPSIMELSVRATLILASRDGVVRLQDLARPRDPEFDDGLINAAFEAGVQAAKRGYRVDSMTLEHTTPRSAEEAYLRLGWLAGWAQKKAGR